MSLFKSQILNCYNLMQYQGDFLLLHCSKDDIIRAPFKGKIEKTQDGCVLYNDDFKMYFNHMNCYKDQDVSVGKAIGTPMVDRYLGENKAYVGVKIYYKNKLQDISLYLSHMDKDIEKEINTMAEEKYSIEEISKPKRKSNNKKKK